MIPGWISLLVIFAIVGLIGLAILLLDIDRKERERERNEDR